MQTPRLRLRAFGLADVPALVAMHVEPRVRELLVDDHPLDRSEVALQFVNGVAGVSRAHPGLGIWHCERAEPCDPQSLAQVEAAVQQGELGPAALEWARAPQWRFCGWFSLMPMSQSPGRVEIGCRLLPDAWGGGLALEGGQALLAHAFGPLGLGEVWAVCHPAHRSVRATLAILGFDDQGERPYCGAPAAHFCIDAAGWARAMAVPRRQRRRAALQRLPRALAA